VYRIAIRWQGADHLFVPLARYVRRSHMLCLLRWDPSKCWLLDSLPASFPAYTCRVTIHCRIVLIRYTLRHRKEPRALTDYEALAELRYQIRRFQHFSEGVARATGLQPQQHQLMLTLKGLPRNIRPRVAELAERLQIKHHSAVELINRLSAGGYVRRHRGGKDHREVLLTLTPKGERILRTLSLYHRAELRTQGPALIAALKRAMATTGISNRIATKSRDQIRSKSEEHATR
jgi:DNA-binding MarR family transcriptional regulator